MSWRLAGSNFYTKRVKMTGWPDITTVFTIKITVGGGVPYHDSDHKDLNLNSVIDVLK